MTYFAAKRWPEPEVWTELVGVQFDLDNVQFCFDLLDPGSSEYSLTEMTGRTVDSLKRYGLSIPSCLDGGAAYSGNLLLHPVKCMRVDALRWWDRAITLAHNLGAKACGGFLGALSCRDMKDKERRAYLERCLIDDIGHLTSIGASLGQESLIWEAMAVGREIPSTISDTERLLKEANKASRIPVRLILDVGKPFGQDLPEDERDPYKWLREFGAQTYCVHLQQTDRNGDRHWPFTERFNELGIISGKKVIEAVERSGARECYLIIEISHPVVATDTEVIEDHKASIRYWKDILGL